MEIRLKAALQANCLAIHGKGYAVQRLKPDDVPGENYVFKYIFRYI